MINKILLVIGVAVLCYGCADNSRTDDAKVRPAVAMLQSPATDSSGEPFLFTDKNGLVYLSWIEKKDKSYHFRFSTFANKKWSVPVTIASGNNWFVNWADYPVIAATGTNHLLALYLEKSDSGAYTYDVKYLTSDDLGKTWSKPRLLNQDGKKAEHGFLSVVPYGERYFVSWLDGRNTVDNSGTGHEGHHGQMTLRAALLGSDGTKEKEWEIDDRVCDCCQTSITMGKQGPVVIYRDRSASEVRDMGSARLVNGEWTAPAIIYADNYKIEGCPVNGPRADAIGNSLAAAWFTVKSDSGEVKVAFSDNGGESFEEPVRVNESSATGRVDLLMIDSATAVVSWLEGAKIQAAKVHRGGGKDAPLTIAQSSQARASGFPQMTKSGSAIFFAWTDTKTKSIKAAKVDINAF
ncbi:sialidase family protein [Flavitalea antarctica]